MHSFGASVKCVRLQRLSFEGTEVGPSLPLGTGATALLMLDVSHMQDERLLVKVTRGGVDWR
jgi:hypothetical protein